MDCTHCEPALLDLCYGELAPAHEREVRAHVLDCPTCRKALARLEAGQALARHLPEEPPPMELTERIMRTAQAHVRRKNGGRLAHLQLMIDSMARIAMTRQVAMATLSLLIVFVGLWSIPQLTGRRDARTALVVEPTHAGETSASHEPRPEPQATPAAAPTLAAESAKHPAGRSRRSAEIAQASSTRKPAAEGAAKRSDKAARTRSAEKASANAAPVASRLQAKPVEPRAQQFAAAPPVAHEVAPAPPPAAAEPEPTRMLLDERHATAAGDAERPQADAVEGLGAGVAKEPVAAAAPVTLEEVFKAGVERYRSEDYAAAAQLFARMLESSAPSAQRAAALLYLARSERALDRCDRALRAYETLVRSYGSAQQSASALSEGVACYDRLGASASAAGLLEHASSVPSLSAQATKMLQDRSAAKRAAPSTADSARP